MKVESAASTAALTGLNKQQDKRLKDACKDFEAIFMSTVLKAMRKTVQKSDLFGSDQGEEMFQDMMDSEVCKSAANTSPTGIADMLYKQLSNQLEHQQQTTGKEVRGTDK